MTRTLQALVVAAALSPFSMPAAAEETPLSAQDFQTRIDEAATPIGKAKAPVACAGLVAALRIASPDESNAKEMFKTLEEEMVFYAMMTRRQDAGEEQQAALDATVPLVRDVSAIYLEWFNQNQRLNGELINSALRTNFSFCERMRDEMKAALESQ
ncbi:hypothetical protein [Pacificoceanicola onchidii]|uniref:hypothetical protein n=1 Tax=Pacificoceanicola onchidii TaxID=2562685 RepID=UPI0010A3EFE3|nr:hypothetical protein [Pacificoceanicola onchidii]